MTRSTTRLLALLAVVFAGSCDDDRPLGNTRVTQSGSVIGPSSVVPTTLPTGQLPAPNHPIFGSAASLSGSCPVLRFVIGRQVVLTDTFTVFRGFTCTSFRTNARIGVQGRRMRDGSMLAAIVELN